jgi:hypothetical protein
MLLPREQAQRLLARGLPLRRWLAGGTFGGLAGNRMIVQVVREEGMGAVLCRAVLCSAPLRSALPACRLACLRRLRNLRAPYPGSTTIHTATLTLPFALATPRAVWQPAYCAARRPGGGGGGPAPPAC